MASPHSVLNRPFKRLSMPVMGVCFDSMGPEPLIIEDGVLVAASWGEDYVLPLEEIESAEIIDALPKNGVRVMGIGLDSFLKGKFKIDGGDATLCLDPRTGPWLKVTMTDGTLYLLGGGGSREDILALLGQIGG